MGRWHYLSSREDTTFFINAFNALLSWLRLLNYIEAISPGPPPPPLETPTLRHC